MTKAKAKAARPLHKSYNPDFSMMFRFKELSNGTFLLTNDSGAWVFLDADEFHQFVDGTIDSSTETYRRLSERNFIRDSFDLDAEAHAYRRRFHYLQNGPILHIMVVTLQCNHTCVYCHASREKVGRTEFDMSIDTANQVLDRVFDTTSPSLTIEFQGGEPLLNWPVVSYVIEQGVERAKRANKKVEFALVSNLSLMDDEKFAFLLEHQVQISTSLDGPEHLHNKNRPVTGCNSYGETVRWIKRINAAYIEKGLDPNTYHVEALLTVSRHSLPYWKEIVDTYVDLGFKTINLRPLNPFGFATTLDAKIGYRADAFIDFYTKALAYIMELNRAGTEILERQASLFLTKILGQEDPNFLDLRSPCGAGVGQIAYNYDGSVFTCDEGRMVHQMGDDAFLIGQIEDLDYRGIVQSETVKSTLIASEVDGLPGAADDVYRPYIGVCPVYNYSQQGSLAGNMATNDRLAIDRAVLDFLFTGLSEGDMVDLDIWGKWALQRERLWYFEH
jgi:His-Xaa-Ser system radical SAM maturase HxsB